MTNLELTMQEARRLGPEHRTPSEVDDSFDRLQEALQDRLNPNTDDTISQIANAPRIQPTDESRTEQSFSEIVAPTSNIQAPAPDALLVTGWVDSEMSNLLKAIIEPDIDTARADRNRAIDLRWVLRDIRSNRLSWSPVNPHDLRMLTIMGLIEMRGDAPVLTNAGSSAIAWHLRIVEWGAYTSYVAGSLEECIRQSLAKPVNLRHLYEINRDRKVEGFSISNLAVNGPLDLRCRLRKVGLVTSSGNRIARAA